jgi:hypothetical protein
MLYRFHHDLNPDVEIFDFRLNSIIRMNNHEVKKIDMT